MSDTMKLHAELAERVRSAVEKELSIGRSIEMMLSHLGGALMDAHRQGDSEGIIKVIRTIREEVDSLMAAIVANTPACDMLRSGEPIHEEPKIAPPPELQLVQPPTSKADKSKLN